MHNVCNQCNRTSPYEKKQSGYTSSHYVRACIVHDDGSVNLRMRIIVLTWKDIFDVSVEGLQRFALLLTRQMGNTFLFLFYFILI
jgi:hypothetical protein